MGTSPNPTARFSTPITRGLSSCTSNTRSTARAPRRPHRRVDRLAERGPHLAPAPGIDHRFPEDRLAVEHAPVDFARRGDDLAVAPQKRIAAFANAPGG